jgi:predicted dehydrogenase
MSDSLSSRRSFLHAAGAALVIPAVHGAAREDKVLNIGLIGSGGRCMHLMKALAKVPKVRMAAVCDVWDVHRERARKLADPKAYTTKNYNDVLADDKIDAVLIASPDHWHVPMTVDACKAGKDVYVEKPLTHDLSEGRAVLEAVKKSRRIVQVGTQQRSMPHLVKGRELIKAGQVGQVHKVRMTWNRNTNRVKRFPLGVDPKAVDWERFLGNARKQEFDEYRFRNWRWFWDFGGGLLTDLMVHWLDVAHWCLGLDHPQKAVTIGDHIAAKDVWETPDTIQTLLSYKRGVQMHFEGNFSNAHRGAMIEFMGSDGTLYMDRGRYEFYPERGKGKPQSEVVGKGRPGLDFYDKPDGELLHLKNWIDGIRTRKDPSAPVAAGVSAAAGAHLGNQAYRGSGAAVWKS